MSQEVQSLLGRNRQSAKKAGTSFETLIADCLRIALSDSAIQRAPRWGSKDKGDIANVKINGKPLVIETKNVARQDLPSWTSEAKVESVNADALAGIVIHKRRGTTDPMRQWVTCTVAELVALITGEHPERNCEKGNSNEHCLHDSGIEDN